MNNPNPYQAPQTLENPESAERSRISTVKRPLSIWLVLILSIIVAAATVWTTISGYYRLFSNPAIHLSGPRLAVTLVIQLALIALPVTIIWGIAKRSPIGRWLGIAALSFLFVASIVNHIKHPPSEDRVTYASDAERAGGEFGAWLGSGLVLALTYRFGFGVKAKAYFSPRPDDDETGEELKS